MNQVARIHDFPRNEIDLIKATVAKGATHAELELFLYRCRHMGLDPLKPGHIHFVKYGNSPGTIVIGLDGFRFKAAQTGKHTGTQRGILKDDKGACVGAWCEVSRSGWTTPARVEVAMSEYNTGKAQWLKMPQTMIQKVAEVAALRMAFPDELGGLYSENEMEQAKVNIQGDLKAKQVQAVIDLNDEPVLERVPLPSEPYDGARDAADIEMPPDELSPFIGDQEYTIPFGKHSGKSLEAVGRVVLADYVKYLEGQGNITRPAAIEFIERAKAYLKT